MAISSVPWIWVSSVCWTAGVAAGWCPRWRWRSGCWWTLLPALAVQEKCAWVRGDTAQVCVYVIKTCEQEQVKKNERQTRKADTHPRSAEVRVKADSGVGPDTHTLTHIIVRLAVHLPCPHCAPQHLLITWYTSHTCIRCTVKHPWGIKHKRTQSEADEFPLTAGPKVFYSSYTTVIDHRLHLSHLLKNWCFLTVELSHVH